MTKIRVLIVDDSVVMRRLIGEALARDPEIEVVGAAAHGLIALAKIPQVSPDVVTLDVEMPEMDGVATVREIRKLYPTLPVIMFSTLTELGAVQTLDALAAGATDYVTKPANVGSINLCVERLEHDLAVKIKTHGRKAAISAGRLSPDPVRQIPSPRGASTSHPIELLCIGSSTGGPAALADLFKHIPRDLPVPIVIVQHMPTVFTRLLADRLDTLGSVCFCEGTEGMPVHPGCGYIAPGGHHMEVVRGAGGLMLHLHDGPPENSCRPAVDVLFRSAARCFGDRVLAVVLTGMGQDGLHGCRMLHELRAPILAQDQASSVVWGMPGCVAEAGLADRVLPLTEIAPEICRRVKATSRRSLPQLATVA